MCGTSSSSPIEPDRHLVGCVKLQSRTTPNGEIRSRPGQTSHQSTRKVVAELRYEIETVGFLFLFFFVLDWFFHFSGYGTLQLVTWEVEWPLFLFLKGSLKFDCGLKVQLKYYKCKIDIRKCLTKYVCLANSFTLLCEQLTNDEIVWIDLNKWKYHASPC